LSESKPNYCKARQHVDTNGAAHARDVGPTSHPEQDAKSSWFDCQM